MAFCAADISCIRKMGVSFKIYDTPYWTEASSLTHPSIQPRESASNAHHVLMSMINLCVGSLWTPFKHPPPKKKQKQTTYSCFRSSNVLTSINPTPAFLYKQKQNNSPSLELHKQTATQTPFNREYGTRAAEKQPLPAQSDSIWTSHFILFSHLHFFYVVFKNAEKKKILVLFIHTFLNRPVRGCLLCFMLLVGWHGPYFNHIRGIAVSLETKPQELLPYNCNQ